MNYNSQPMGNRFNEFQSDSLLSLQEVRTDNQSWCGEFSVLAPKFNKDQILLKKTLHLYSYDAAKLFIKQYKELEKPDFYLRHPLRVQLDGSDKLCSFNETVHVYHEKLYPCLLDKMRESGVKYLKQCQIWFILSEMVHSLELLYDRGHPHLWITPKTIYFNKNENWFLEDMYFWQGPDYQNFLKYKIYCDELISVSAKQHLQKNQVIDLRNALDEDTYCLGYCVLFMMTGVRPTEARKYLNRLLEQCEIKYSKKLLNLVSSMTQQICENRIGMDKLRYRLKAEEEIIIAKQIEQFQSESYKKKMIENEKMTVQRKLKTPIKGWVQPQNMRRITNNDYSLTNPRSKLIRQSEHSQTESGRIRSHYSPVMPAKTRTSQFFINSPRF